MINKFANLDILEYDFAQGGALAPIRLRSGRRISTSAHQHPFDFAQGTHQRISTHSFGPSKKHLNKKILFLKWGF